MLTSLRRRALLGAGSLLLAVLTPGVVSFAQIRPRFMIAFDTSGSMSVDLNNIPSFGDGITGPTRGMDTDCDGLANDSRLFVAKEALRDMILAFGDIEFGLTRFPMLTRENTICNDSGGLGPGFLAINAQECSDDPGPFVGSLGDPTLNNGPAVTTTNCGANWDGNPVTLETPASLFPAACRPGSAGFPPIRRWDVGSPSVCINYLGSCPSDTIAVPGSGIFRWPAGDVLVGFSGFGWPAAQDNRPGILRWIDNRETAFDATSTEGNWCNHATTGDCELRANGPTPLGGILRASRDYLVPTRASDPTGACRPYTVLLLTDGVESCEPNPANMNHPVNVARELFMTSGIPVYVVGLAIDPDSRDLLNNIATAGGTDAGAVGGDTAFFANDPDTLSGGLSEIVRRSLLIEVCNDLDDNCNGVIDEGFVKFCNRPAGVTANTLCADPGETVCDGMDDNCNGGVDEGLLNACGGCGMTPGEVCDGLDNDCDGLIDEGVCGSGCVPEVEVCDGIDNDCDRLVDEGVTRPCGTDTGECTIGTETCAMGVFSGCTGVGPVDELCDGLDNDCDGVADGFTEPCGPDEGACVPGSRLCTGGDFGACIGAVGPTDELCNGEDDDCDGMTDEGNPGGGATCGGGTCGVGTITCIMGRLVCEGGGEPAPEICDGRDNDCDGETDEDVPPRGACGPDVGECLPGREVCRAGEYVCEGGIGPRDEICNGRDDDCDGEIDEMLDGTMCGTDEGECAPGTLRCTDGAMICSGEVPPGPELCDCRDNDCDGEVDEVADGASALCPAGSACVSCQCALPCADTEFPCPVGRTCQEFPEGRFCVGSLCDNAACATMTVERGGETICSPEGPRCTCRGNDCAPPCEGVECREGTVCRPADGRCVENNCRELGCSGGQLCYHGECQPDRCAMMSCAEACRDGACVDSCNGVECGPSERCDNGRCVATGCGECPIRGTVCNPTTRECVANACGDRTCAGVPGTVCEPSTGACVDDECVVVRCPEGETCSFGSCFGPGDVPGVRRERVLASGGGGTVCSAAAPGAGDGSDSRWGWLTCAGALVLALGLLRRRRRSIATILCLLASAGISASATSGCKVDPYCLNCSTSEAGTDAGRDGQMPSNEAGLREGGTLPDGASPDGCVPGASEECNGTDDDCDGQIDEEYDTNVDVRNCGECGNACTPPNAFPACTAGVCGIARCDVGYYDLDGDLANGCEYRCLPTSDEDTTCDERDDDCDGETDEEASVTTDPRNCGACGNECRFDQASSVCMAGTCALGACITGYVDLDGDPENGCEYRCAPTGDEACNGLDDDCDGMTDEGNPGGGAPCGGTVGSCRPGTRACTGGSLICMGGVDPTIETCNGADDDCNGTVDDGFSFMTDIRNCGGCGRTCEIPGAIVRCTAGSCERVRCATGFVDRDGDPANGCEYACDMLGGEVCNGRDDDCDGMVDEGLTPPPNFCNRNGACAGTGATCDGALGWRCHYPAAVETTDADHTVIGPETRCDGVDGNCNGVIDDPFPTVGSECANGVGACRRIGLFACNAGGDGVACNAPPPGAPSDETCNDVDDDCDGVVDDADRDGDGSIEDAELRAFGMARVTSGGRTFYFMRWEASRPDATATAAGSTMTRACSRQNVLPWTTVTYTAANNACCALNASGTCSGATGWRLCSAADWQVACEGGSGCDWAYSSSCTASQPTSCNGAEFDAYPGPAACMGAGDQDCVTATGSTLFPMCSVSWDGDAVFDLSGNVKEWTSTARGGGTHEIRGGSFNNLEDGRACDFDFTVAADAFAFPNTGFRCCYVP